MSSRTLAALQERIVDSVKAAHKGTTQTAISAVAGVHKSQVSHWLTAQSEIKLSELVAMIAEYGAPAVLGPIAHLDQCEVSPRQAGLIQCVRSLRRSMGRVLEHTEDATCPKSDGGEAVTGRELIKALPDLRELRAQVDALIVKAEKAERGAAC